MSPAQSAEGAQGNPLLEAPATSLDELFSRDPLDLSDQDLSVIVVELRRQRVRWKQAEAEGKTARAPKAKAPKLTADQAQALSLADLGLE